MTTIKRNDIIIIVNEREVNKMKTVIIEYAMIDPVTLINKIEKAFPGAMARFTSTAWSSPQNGQIIETSILIIITSLSIVIRTSS